MSAALSGDVRCSDCREHLQLDAFKQFKTAHNPTAISAAWRPTLPLASTALQARFHALGLHVANGEHNTWTKTPFGLNVMEMAGGHCPLQPGRGDGNESACSGRLRVHRVSVVDRLLAAGHSVRVMWSAARTVSAATCGRGVCGRQLRRCRVVAGSAGQCGCGVTSGQGDGSWHHERGACLRRHRQPDRHDPPA